MKPIKILVVDDDEGIVELLKETLSEEGWHILIARNGSEALKKVENDSPDLVVLEIMIPKVDGFEVCSRLRKWTDTPIITLSARADREDKVRCLNLGADDYITKPFGVDELIARIKAVLRRNKINDNQPVKPPFICGGINIDFTKRRVCVEGTEVSLTPTEYKLLLQLVTNVDETLTYAQLLKEIWGQEFREEREYVHVYIGHLRNKLESDPKNPKYIISVPRVGYRFQKMI
jgi:two-component system KDP operon response regulator KdpE